MARLLPDRLVRHNQLLIKVHTLSLLDSIFPRLLVLLTCNTVSFNSNAAVLSSVSRFRNMKESPEPVFHYSFCTAHLFLLFLYKYYNLVNILHSIMSSIALIPPLFSSFFRLSHIWRVKTRITHSCPPLRVPHTMTYTTYSILCRMLLDSTSASVTNAFSKLLTYWWPHAFSRYWKAETFEKKRAFWQFCVRKKTIERVRS